MYELPDEAKSVLDRVLKDQESSERRHKNHRKKWEHFYGLYRSHQSFREWYHQADTPDRDMGLRDLSSTWGAELFIPYSFETVEQVTPRVVSDLPTQPLGPRGDTDPENVDRMRTLVEQQQKQISYDMKLQDTAKSAFIYGLGIQKGPFWRTETRQMPVLERGTENPWVQGVQTRTLFDDPDVEDVDIFDFFWDPFASSLRRPDCRWVIHRTWRNTAYCRKMLEVAEGGTGWNNPHAFPVDELDRLGAGGRYDEFHRARLSAAGHDDLSTRNDSLHEVWEYHDGTEVITILDREIVVQKGPNPAWHGDLMFHAFRPTTSGVKELTGIGEVEPIEHLQIEMNTLRSQRRDNATITLQRAYAYAEGFVDPDNLKVGPGVAIPVNGDPRELLFPLPVQDIPASGYQEEANLIADIERVTGLRDQGSTGSDTATGAQIVQQASSVRIRNKARRLHAEIVTPQTDQWILLNQQHVVDRTLTMPESEAEPGVRSQKWKHVKLGPAELAGDMYALPVDEGSTMPDNVAQMRQDGMQIWNMFGNNPNFDQRELGKRVLRLMGAREPDNLLTPENRVPPALMDLLIQSGAVPEDVLRQLFEEAQQMEEQEKLGAQGDQTSPEPQEASA